MLGRRPRQVNAPVGCRRQFLQASLQQHNLFLAVSKEVCLRYGFVAVCYAVMFESHSFLF
jgi:hypothetical protein